MMIGSLHGEKKWETILNHVVKMLERAKISTLVSIERSGNYSFTVIFSNENVATDGQDILTQSFCDKCVIIRTGKTRVYVNVNIDRDRYSWFPNPLPGTYDSFWLKYQAGKREISPMFFDPKVIGKKLPGFNRYTPCSGRWYKRCRLDDRNDEKGSHAIYGFLFEEENGEHVDATPRVCTRFRGKRNVEPRHSYAMGYVSDLRVYIWEDYIEPARKYVWQMENLKNNGVDTTCFESFEYWTDKEVQEFARKTRDYYINLVLRRNKDRRLKTRRLAHREKVAMRNAFIDSIEEVTTD